MVTSRSLDAAAIAKVHYDDAFNGRDFAKGYAVVAEDVTWLNVPAGMSLA